MSELDSAILRTIIDAAHDHFFVVDASGQVRDVSPGAAAVYGMSCEALRGSNSAPWSSRAYSSLQ